MTQPIWYDSTEAGAPTLNNVAGSMLEVLRACLVNGFGAKTVTSISVSAGVATATSAAHGFTDKFGKLVLIAGASEPLLNGRKQPLSVSTNSFTFAAPGVADGTYTGTMNARRAPLGWAEAYSGTNKAIFARTAPEASSQMLRVVDNAAAPTDARAMCVETATDVDTFTGVSPAPISGGFYWWKGANTTAAKRWILVGDDRIIHFFTDLSGSGHYRPFLFGDVNSFKAGDGYPTLIAGEATAGTGAGSSGWTGDAVRLLGQSAFNNDLTIARAHTQIGSSVSCAVYVVGSGVIGNVPGMTYPGPISNGCVISQPIYVAEDIGGSQVDIRGLMPGAAQPLTSRPFAERQVVDGLIGTDRKFLAVPLISSSGGQLLVDLTGPWY